MKRLKKSTIFFICATLFLIAYFFASLPYGFNGSSANITSGSWCDENILDADTNKNPEYYNDSNGLRLADNNSTVLIFNEYQLGYWAYMINNDKGYADKNVRLMNNINLGITVSGRTLTWTPVYLFQKQFNGQSYTINNMTIEMDNNNGCEIDGIFYVGFIEYVDNTGLITNLSFENCKITGDVGGDYAKVSMGFVAGANHGTIQNCIIGEGCSVWWGITYSDNVSNVSFGGIAGCSYGTIVSCFSSFGFQHSNNKRISELNLGGIAGKIIGGNISVCLVDSCFDSIHNVDKVNVGGVAGHISGKSNITQCGNTSYIFIGNYDNRTINTAYVGGIVGYSESTGAISYSYNRGTIEAFINNQTITERDETNNLVAFNKVRPISAEELFVSCLFGGNSITNTNTMLEPPYTKISITDESNNLYIGGIVGYLAKEMNITSCYNTKEIRNSLKKSFKASFRYVSSGHICYENNRQIYIYEKHYDIKFDVTITYQKNSGDLIGGGKDKGNTKDCYFEYIKGTIPHGELSVDTDGAIEIISCEKSYSISVLKQCTSIEGMSYVESEVGDGIMFYNANYDTIFSWEDTNGVYRQSDSVDLYDFDIKYPSVWAQDSTINGGQPYLKRMYWKNSMNLQQPASVTFNYTFNDTNKTATLSGVTIVGNITEVEIPETVVYDGDSYEVTAIGEGAFAIKDGNGKYIENQNSPLKQVVLPNTITSIGNLAFYGCSNLETVNMPTSLKIIRSQAFDLCRKLKNVTLPNGLETIESLVFASCNAFTEITIPNSVKTIGWRAFGWTYNLQKLTTPFIGYSRDATGEKALLGYMFGDKENTQYYNTIYQAYAYNPETKQFTYRTSYIPKKLTTVIINSEITKIQDYAFWGCSSITNVTLPDSVRTIGENSFVGCSELFEINFNGIETFGLRSFMGCIKLASVNFDNTRFIGDNAFHGCGLTSVSLPITVESIGKYAFYNCGNLEDVEMLSSLKIEEYSFAECNKLTSVESWNITTIENYAFYKCSSLTTISLMDGLFAIGDFAFEYCTQLNKITLPNSLKTLGQFAFASSGLTSVTMSNNLTTIGKCAFAFCSKLKTITNFENCDKLSAIPEQLFYECRALQSITIPKGVHLIGKEVFFNCKTLRDVNLPDGLEIIGESAFVYCEKLKINSLNISSLKTIGDYAFKNCSSLTVMTLFYNINSVGVGAFENCSSLSSINWPTSANEIKNRTFYGCSKLTTIGYYNGKNFIAEKLPNNITSIGNEAFYNCGALQLIALPSNLTNLGTYAFRACTNITITEIPKGVTVLSEGALWGCEKIGSLKINKNLSLICNGVFTYTKDNIQINFNGTMLEWKKLHLGSIGLYNATIKCSDGTLNFVAGKFM